MTSLLDQLECARATYNRRHVGELMEMAHLNGAADTVRGGVVVVRETEPERVLGLVFLCWAFGGVPLLAPTPLRDRQRWVDGSGSYLVEGAAVDWGIPEGCALLQTTSGSTGREKIAMRGRESLEWERLAYRELFGTPTHSLLHNVRLEHSLGFGLTLAAMLDGRAVLHAEPQRSGYIIDSADELCVVGGTPSTLRVLIRNWSQDLVRPGAVFCGAGRLVPEIVAARDQLWPKARIVTGFGSTETGGVLGGDESGDLIPLAGVEVLSPKNGDMDILGVRMPHHVLGYLEKSTPAQRADNEWVFSDIVHERSHGRYKYVGRISKSFRHREQYYRLTDLSSALVQAERNWTFAEFETTRGARECALVVEGGPLGRERAAQISAIVKNIDESISVRTVAKLPITELGKIRWDELVRMLGESDGEEAVV